MNRKCPRTLDKPILLFGLEMEDVGLLGAIGGIGSILMGPIIPGILSIAGWFVLIHFKKDKPAGYLIHWLYNVGIDFPGLIPPIKKVQRYGIYARSAIIQKFTVS
jgi:hypothetical protein